MTLMRDNPDCHKLPILATNGKVFLLTVEEISGILSLRRYYSPMFMFCLTLALIDPLVFQTKVILPWRIVFWSMNGLFVTLAWYAQFRFFAWLWTVLKLSTPLPSAVLISFSVTALLLVNYGVATNLLEMPELWEGQFLTDLVRYVLVVLVFETALATFLFPLLLDQYRGTKDPTDQTKQNEQKQGRSPKPEAKPATLVVNGKRIDVSTVLYLKSVEHYVEIVQHEMTELIRATLREIVAALEPSHGIQPHRSYWVARHAIIGVNRSDGNMFLVITDGSEVPVSRHRKREVTAWLADHL